MVAVPADLRPRDELGGGGGIKGSGGPRRGKHSTTQLTGKRLMRAAWWWIDRWRKSTAYTDMSLAEQGAYRNLLDELWLRDGAIPNDERILAKVCGDPFEWPKVREKVLARFKLTSEGWRNDTHDEVAKGSKDFRESQAEKGRKGARVRWCSPANGPASSPANGLPSPSPSPSPSVPSSQSSGEAPRSNPLVKGRRVDLERECLALVSRLAELTNQDPIEVIAFASGYKGAATTKLNPATMSDDRLANTVRDLRRDVKAEELRREKREAIYGKP